MRALTWQGVHDVQVKDVPDPILREPTDALVRISSAAICGSDLHLYEVLGAYMSPGDVLGHEAIGFVEEIGSEVINVEVGDRVVMPFQVACGDCFMCHRGLQTQCEVTQVRSEGMGAMLFGFSQLYGQLPGGQAQYLRVPYANDNAMKVPEGPHDERFLYLSDVLPTAWQGVEYADIPDDGTVVILGVGPIGDMACRIARHRGHRVIAVDLVPERLARVRDFGAETIDLRDRDKLGDAIRDMTEGRGPDSVIDAVGMEAHGSPVAKFAQLAAAMLPDQVGQSLMQKAGVDRLAALYSAIDIVRRGGTISLSGVYGGSADPLPMLTMFDKQLSVRMGQANVRRWVDDILPLLSEDDPLGVDAFASHRIPLEQAPHGYKIFQQKRDGACKIVLKP